MRFKNLNKFRVGGTTRRMLLAFPPPRTPDGRVYRYSPNESAHPRHFVLGDRTNIAEPDDRQRSRMKQPPGSKRTVCPYSGVVADDDEFNHPDDVRAARKVFAHAVVEDATDGLHEILENAARKSSGVLTYKRASRQRRPQPRFGRRDLMRVLICDHCGRDYGVFAIALFCPDCGAPNIALHFAREAELVGAQVQLAEGLDKDQQELAYRLLGNAHEDVLTAFEATLKTLYAHGKLLAPSTSQSRPVGNDFQNIERGQSRFAELGINPFSTLTSAEMGKLRLNIQKRHVVGHNLGVVDAKFAQAANDAKLGETVKLVGAEIREFSEICQKVVGYLDSWLGGQAPGAGVQTRDDVVAPVEAKQDSVGGLGTLATAIASWISRSSETGLSEPVDPRAMEAAFAGNGTDLVLEAIAELEAQGYVATSQAIGLKVPRVRSTTDLFLTFDPIVFEASPTGDAIQLGEMVLAGPPAVRVKDLHEKSGLALRRFNPAISMIIAEVGEGRVSREVGVTHYPTRHFHVTPEDRVAIRGLLDRLKG